MARGIDAAEEGGALIACCEGGILSAACASACLVLASLAAASLAAASLSAAKSPQSPFEALWAVRGSSAHPGAHPWREPPYSPP
eukprot:jgi/Chrpa1/3209/Chrysochromulina_OHIO_Genome00002389-RA